MGREVVGGFEQLVLLAIHHLRGAGYTVSIAAELQRRTRRSSSLGAIYTTTDRLEKKGLISSQLGEPTPERGGKPKRFFQITAAGIQALDRAREADRLKWSDSTEGVLA